MVVWSLCLNSVSQEDGEENFREWDWEGSLEKAREARRENALVGLRNQNRK